MATHWICKYRPRIEKQQEPKVTSPRCRYHGPWYFCVVIRWLHVWNLHLRNFRVEINLKTSSQIISQRYISLPSIFSGACTVHIIIISNDIDFANKWYCCVIWIFQNIQQLIKFIKCQWDIQSSNALKIIIYARPCLGCRHCRTQDTVWNCQS